MVRLNLNASSLSSSCISLGNTTLLLRAEGLVAFAAGLAGYFSLTDSWLFLAGAALLPDLSMIGYLCGPMVGAHIYNASHTYLVPALLVALALATGLPLLPLACVWVSHIGIDRALGYGLKCQGSFHDTHLGPIGRVHRDAAV